MKAFVVLILSRCMSLFAATAADVLKMSSAAQSSYLSGAIDMARLTIRDPAKVSACVVKWQSDKTKAESEVAAALKQEPDKPAAALIRIIIRKHCNVTE